MIILGLYDGHNCNACVIKNRKILAAAEEERFSRIKMHDGRYNGLPSNSLNEVIKKANIDKEDIDYIAIALEDPILLQIRALKDLIKQKNLHYIFFYYKNWMRFGPLHYFSPFTHQLKRKKRILKFLRENNLEKKPIKWINHHTAHAASAYYTSNKPECLAISIDGKGDGLSGIVYKCKDGAMTKISEISSYDSICRVYSAITINLGFKANKHEGKITGLAAYGNPQNAAYDTLKKSIIVNKEIKLKLMENEYIAPYPYHAIENVRRTLNKKLKKYNLKREDLAAAIQKKTEESTVKYIKNKIEETGIHNICLAGGLFSNVKINQKISELNGADSIFIHPAMNDSGLSVGAALYTYANMEGLMPFELKNVYLGPDYNKTIIRNTLEKTENIHWEKSKNIEKDTSELISENKVVGRFNGAMEYGPRALGNRSIIYPATDRNLNNWLNKRLKRTEFMPFAPSTLEKNAEEIYINFEKNKYPARFMTITFDLNALEAKKYPAITHVDNTARPQVVKKEYNPSYYNILKHYKSLTGDSCFVNTSFNMHEEPIVCTPQDAIKSFMDGRLDILSIGNYIVTQK